MRAIFHYLPAMIHRGPRQRPVTPVSPRPGTGPVKRPVVPRFPHPPFLGGNVSRKRGIRAGTGGDSPAGIGEVMFSDVTGAEPCSARAWGKPPGPATSARSNSRIPRRPRSASLCSGQETGPGDQGLFRENPAIVSFRIFKKNPAGEKTGDGYAAEKNIPGGPRFPVFPLHAAAVHFHAGPEPVVIGTAHVANRGAYLGTVS